MTKEQEILDHQDQLLDGDQVQELEEVVAEGQDSVLEFEEATQMTVQDALHKESDLQAGITEEDSVLDRYIKKHPEAVGEQKFVNKVGDLDTKALDDFIQQQRAELEERKAELLAGAVFGTAAATAAASQLGKKAGDRADKLVTAGQDGATQLSEQAGSALETSKATAQAAVEGVADQVNSVSDKKTEVGSVPSSTTSFDDLVAKDRLLDNPSLLEEKSSKKGKAVIIGGVAALMLAAIGAGYGLNYLNQAASNQNTTTSTEASSSTTSSSSTAAAAELQNFEDLYASFFVDGDETKLKNSEFDKLSELETTLQALEGTADYDAAKTKFDNLSKTVAAIQAINDKFETPVIVDGERVEAPLKEGASFDDLSSDVLNTGKANIDTLIQGVIAEARGLISTGGGTVSAGGAVETAGQAVVSDATAEVSQPVVETPVEAVVQETAPVVTQEVVQDSQPVVDNSQVTQVVTELPVGHIQAPTPYGLVSYDPSTLQRHLSRVPFNYDLIADTANPSWTFNPGVLEEIIRVSQQRGYINGYEFILEPVNIINGNGYYNMYKPDGTYLFSINAKTGYFVGNGRGYAEDLDY